MPREWYDKHAANKIEDPSKRSLYRSIVADKKPYFMRYIYPALMKQYNTYIKNTERNALREFQMTIGKHNSMVKFDYTIMRSDAGYTPKQYASIKRLYEDYNKRLASYSVFADYERVDDFDTYTTLSMMNDEFRKECEKICPCSKTLCNIILDMCYSKSSTKRFAWSMCGEDIIHNLLEANNQCISYPVISDNGDFEYCGETYTVETTTLTIGGIE